MQKILITGITGFVGQNLESYLSKDFECVGISRKSDATKNITDYNTYFNSSELGFAIIHLAGKAHDLKKTSNDNEYFEVNFELTKKIYDKFLQDSQSEVFIYLSSVKAVKDSVAGVLTENDQPTPVTPYGKSKLMAEEYILKNLPTNHKRVYILRPCMIHGPGNKGNMNLLYGFASKGLPYPMAAYQNQSSFLSVDNLSFVIKELLIYKVPSGVYNVADDQALSTNQVIELMAHSLNTKPKLLAVPKRIINAIARMGDHLKLPINSERLNKMTENYVVSNHKIKTAIQKELPLSVQQGLLVTFNSFKK